MDTVALRMDVQLTQVPLAAPHLINNIDSEEKEHIDQPGILNNSDCADPANLTLESKNVELPRFPSVRGESSPDAEDKTSVSPPSSASASILSMPDPLSSSDTTSVQYDTIHISDYTRLLEYESSVSSPSVTGHGIGINAVSLPPQFRNERSNTFAPQRLPESAYRDLSDHDFESESEPESESSFPSVTSSFFFSSPASVASHGPGEDSHEDSNEDRESRSLRATQELVIPSLMLPEALNLPSVVHDYPLETPHPPKPSIPHSQAPSASDVLRLLVVAPSDLRRPSIMEGDQVPYLSQRVKKDFDDVVSQTNALHLHAARGYQPELHSVVADQDMETVLATVIDAFVKNELFTAVVLTSEISHDVIVQIKHEIAQFSEALSPLVPVIYLLRANASAFPDKELSSSQSTARRLSSSLQNSPLIPTAALSVSSVQELHELLIRPDVSQRLQAEAAEKSTRWFVRRNTFMESTRLDDTSIAKRRARTRGGHEGDGPTFGQNQDNTSISANRHDVNSGGGWRQFKAQWEASWEDAYSLQPREIGSQQDSDEELLRTARFQSSDPSSSSAPRLGTLKARKQSRLKRSSFARPSSSSSSSSPVPATSPSLPPSSALPSTMPSSLSLSDSLFISADEIPDTPPLPPIPLVMEFPFPSSTISLRPPSTRNSSRARSRGPPYHASEKYTPHPTPFLLDFDTGRFNPLHLPSFVALSLSVLAPLRGHIRAATRRIFSVSSRVANSLSISGGFEDEDQSADDKLLGSTNSVESVDNEVPSSSSSLQFRKGLWPTGMVLVGGFLLGFAVGYLRGL
ncbi:uncharacterized protein C8R40DRAFT_1066890 [Lentinula edodes]|uniref:uncharacterized protein n=1 Tax=Lentinula edodes TaxID=5353 RepID=UPI001E8D7827|nr:uncharacterized protein C8R40DRAFT_1066890 [Lentinula edodes]KAH7878431.1 hypothetical protein C8R40DRAFT_1066890 [Lentinula edodes]